MEQVAVFLKQFGVLVGVAVIGLGMLIYGLWGQLLPQQATVEIIKGSSNQNTSDTVVVDVAGEVERPGVYTLPNSSRMGDAIVLAGGFSAAADRNWVAQMLNLASELKDGQKIYIPARQEALGASPGTPSMPGSQGKININTASLGELDSLPGIGEVRAQAIAAQRPYGDIAELISKAQVPQSVFEKIKNQISTY